MKLITNSGETVDIDKESFVVIADDDTTYELRSTDNHLYIKKVMKSKEDPTLKIIPVSPNTAKFR